MVGYCLELAVKSIRGNLKLSLLAMLTMALGLAGCMSTLTLLNALAADPLPGRSDSLYLAWVRNLPATVANTSKVREPTRLVPSVAMDLMRQSAGAPAAVVSDAEADVEVMDGHGSAPNQTILLTSSRFPELFGLQLQAGRFWGAAEDMRRDPVAVIDTKLAKRLFGTNEAINRLISLNGEAYRIIGVSEVFHPQPHFIELDAWSFDPDTRESVFVPYSTAKEDGVSPLYRDGCQGIDRNTPSFDPNVNIANCAWLTLWVQLTSPSGLKQYGAFLQRYALESSPDLNLDPKGDAKLYSVMQWLKRRAVVPANARINVWLAFSFLALCMVNVAGLLTAKLMRTSSEIGLRRALGAPRRAVFFQHCMHSLIVCIFGGVIAVPMTVWGLAVIRHQDPSYYASVQLNFFTFLGLLSLAISTGLLVGALPAWRGSMIEPATQIKSD